MIGTGFRCHFRSTSIQKNATQFPVLSNLPSGTNVGGANLQAFFQYMLPRLFAATFGGGMLGFKVYGIKLRPSSC